jgi:choline-sulfatase
MLPGHSLLDIAAGHVPERIILSEYHAAGAISGAYMIRCGKYKYIHYVGLPPMLFDLERDPHERVDLGRNRDYGAVIADCEAALRKVVDPETADRLAKADQQAHIEKYGGKDAILKRGTFRYSPPPGAKPAYY